VCGEAAGVPALAALFVGLGVDELSVAAARLDEVRAAVRSLSADRAADAAAAALHAASATDALALGEELVSSELGDEARERVDGLGGVVA